MADKTLYGKDSIESLSPLEFTRLRPGVYAGDTTYSTQLLVEIVSNAVDEFRLGHGNKIEVTLKGKKVRVRDYGQGFLVNEKRDDGTTVLEAAFSVLNTSGKYREDGTYEGTSLGSFGIGSKITNYLSHWLYVQTIRGGQCEEIDFIEGEFSKRKIGKTSNSTGTIVEWEPSEEFFTNVEVEVPKIKSLFKTIVCLCPGLTISLDNNGEKTQFFSKNGLNDLADDFVKGNELINNRLIVNFTEGKYKLDLILTYTSNYSSTFVSYVNAGLVETSPILTQLKTAITRETNKFFREKKWLKDKDDNLSGDDLQEGMLMVFNATCPSVAYDSQVKTRVVSMDCKLQVASFVENYVYWLNNNEKEIKVIADKAISAKKAREAAKKARENARNKAAKKQKVLKFDSKLADASSKDREKCEIYIVEGDSAAGNLKLARDKKYQAVLPIRGKILNVRKATLDKIQKNAEIMTMIEAFGLKVDTKTMKLTYDKDELRYGKIIIESDADIDGAHIKNLFYTFIWTFCPELILDGYVYAGVPPLYKVTIGKDKIVYLKDDAALFEFKEVNKGKKYQVNRLKGLGEMSVDETDILVEPDQRIIKQIQVDNIKATDDLFDDLMGTKVEPRKRYVKEHSAEATYGI